VDREPQQCVVLTTKLLTLANRDRIPMSLDAKLVFEPRLPMSPANGMVFMSSSALDWRPIVQGWLKSRSTLESETLRPLFAAIYGPLIDYVHFCLKAKMLVLECNYIKQTSDLLNGLIPAQDGKSLTKDHLEKLYVFAVMWSLDTLLELDDCARLQEKIQSFSKVLSWPKLDGDSIFNFLVDNEGQWVHWSKRVEEFVYHKDEVLPFKSILVPNIDNVRTDFLIDIVAKQRKAVLLIGEGGTAKTVMIIKGYCRRYNQDEQLFKSLTFSSTSTPNGFQRTIESYVEKRVGTRFGPPSGK
jgi:dynein heavy chain